MRCSYLLEGSFGNDGTKATVYVFFCWSSAEETWDQFGISGHRQKSLRENKGL
jgi:hypothetical protein